MCLGSERTWESGTRSEERLGEIRRLFERYRTEARRYQEMAERPVPVEVSELERDDVPAEPVLT